jgi:hypothetical protein
MRFQIRTLQVPTRGAGAFTPTLTIGGAPATNGQNKITGSPGTTQVASPRPAAMRDGSWGGLWQNSAVTPDFILPSIYVSHANSTLRFPGKIKNDNPLPVPAVNIGYSALQTQKKFRIGGRTVTAAVRPFTVWQTYNNS